MECLGKVQNTNPISCVFALGRVAGVYGTATSVFLSPVGGLLVTVALMALANATCEAGMSQKGRTYGEIIRCLLFHSNFIGGFFDR